MKNVKGEEIYSSKEEKIKFYNDLYEPQTYTTAPKFFRSHTRGKDDFFHQIIIPFVVGHDVKSVLDVGAHNGRYCAMFSDAGIPEVTGLEITPERVQKLRETLDRFEYPQVKTLCGDIETLNFTKYYDFIFCSDLIEHLEDYRKTWEKIMEYSKYAYALIPRGDSWNWSPDHVNIINDDDIIFMIKTSGGLQMCSVVEYDENNSWYCLLVGGLL